MLAILVGKIREVPPGTMAQVTIGGKPVALCNVDGTIHAIDGVCPHRGAPLAHGALHGHTVVCPWHAWEFDCRTGAGDCADVRTYPVRVENGEIYVDA